MTAKLFWPFFVFMRKLWKYFIFIFGVSFILINWERFGWVFNYRVVGDVISDRILLSDYTLQETPDYNFVFPKEGILEITKIDISVPINFFDNPDESTNVLHDALDTGTVHFPQSVLPGQIGQTIILGHSAPPLWPKIKYDWVFNDLSKLESGDEITIKFNGQQHVYGVTQHFIIGRGEEAPRNDLADSRNVLLLISCWPPGKNVKRIVVEAVIKEIKYDYSN